MLHNYGNYTPENQTGLAQDNYQQYAGMDAYTVDMVFCIDATGSMEQNGSGQKKIINMVKEGAISFYDDLTRIMEKKDKHIRQLRIRIVAFRDYLADGDQAMLVTDFFMLPQQTEDFAACINSINACGGGDVPEDGLEALSYAIRSDWTQEGMKKRQVIVVWTDAPTHPLQSGRRAKNYPSGMPKDLAELTDWWSEYMDDNYKRLVLFAPDEQHWSVISENWSNVVHFPSKAGNGLAEQSYETIMNALANSI